jgi:hypothetical protein
MKYKIPLSQKVVSLLFIIGIFHAPVLYPAEYETPGVPDQQVIHLFNGRDLEGWYTWIADRGKNNDPKDVFTVRNEMIRISGEEWGCITTLESFENYRLVVEFKWGEKTFDPRTDRARDSGVLLHSVGDDGGSQGIWMHSIECQIIEGGTGDIIVVGDGSDRFQVTCEVAPEKQGASYVYMRGGDTVTVTEGRMNWFGRDPDWKDVTGFRGVNDVAKPRGEWNVLECIADHGELTYILNGVVVNRAIRVRPASGQIQIQSEGAEIFFRKIDIELFEQGSGTGKGV